ncbi:pentapeptide repeat-containing protein [Streptomyces sp. BRB081]|uniref:pentapeptide repeat-containing protein n=1 Tax=Streptomyces sp. BRB081 TaxID=2769544 RepID=UPI0035ABF181
MTARWPAGASFLPATEPSCRSGSRGRSLSRVRLVDADLTGVSLSGAALHSVGLAFAQHGVNLQDVELPGACSSVRRRRMSTHGANLRGADLRGGDHRVLSTDPFSPIPPLDHVITRPGGIRPRRVCACQEWRGRSRRGRPVEGSRVLGDLGGIAARPAAALRPPAGRRRPGRPHTADLQPFRMKEAQWGAVPWHGAR